MTALNNVKVSGSCFYKFMKNHCADVHKHFQVDTDGAAVPNSHTGRPLEQRIANQLFARRCAQALACIILLRIGRIHSGAFFI